MRGLQSSESNVSVSEVFEDERIVLVREPHGTLQRGRRGGVLALLIEYPTQAVDVIAVAWFLRDRTPNESFALVEVAAALGERVADEVHRCRVVRMMLQQRSRQLERTIVLPQLLMRHRQVEERIGVVGVEIERRLQVRQRRIEAPRRRV